MEQLPYNIAQKLENLPIVSFNNANELQSVIMSQDFLDILTYYEEHYMPDAFKKLQEIQKRIALYLTLTNQDINLTEQIDSLLYRRPVPTIEEFLTGKFYMYNSNATLYPYWRKQLEYMFREGSPVRKTIFGGSIGVGKSTIARKAFLYVLYRILCLRYPRAVFNIDNDATIANVIISMTLKQVYETNLLPFVKLMETMPCFQRVMRMQSFENFDLSDPHCPIPFNVEKSTGTIYFPDNIILTSGSGITHTIGLNIVNSFMDEINEKGVEEALALLNSVDNRFSSRFQGSPLVFQSVVSSARTTNSPIGEYIRRLPKNDPSILILAPRLWEVKEDPEFLGDGSTFPVLVGNGSIPSKIFTDPGELKALEDGNYVPPIGCEVIDVPTVYKEKFELQLEQSIQDIAGMTTVDNSTVFRDISKLEDAELPPEFNIKADINDNNDILALLDEYKLWEQLPDRRWVFKRAPFAKRYCHVDLAGGGDSGQCDAGICIGHKEWHYNENKKENETIYVVDLLIAVNARNKIDIHSIETFLTNLVIEKNMPIHTVSSDQWNGEIFQQNLAKSGCFEVVNKVSVDIKLEPYTNASTLIELGQVKVGTCPKLKKELSALIFDKGKVTRTTELKDLADVLVGFIYNAQLNYADFPQYEYVDTKNIKEKVNDYTNFIDQSSEELFDLI
nr:MAG TPA: terminase [Caudoviricetes sp.]